MLQLATIIVIFISIACGSFALILLARMRKLYRLDYLNSFFYYEMLHLVFGVYGILGSLAIREILLKYDLGSNQLEAIVMAFPFFGVPFIIAAWYLLIKTCNELVSRKTPQYISIIYFSLTTLFFLVYGLIIRSDPGIVPADYGNMTQVIRIAFYVTEMAVKLYLFIMLIINGLRMTVVHRRMFTAKFSLLMLLLGVVTAAGLHFASYSPIVGLYFLLVFFASDLLLILLMRNYLSANASEYRDITDAVEDLFQKYGISRREKEIIRQICLGKTNQEIADELFISLQTVKDHTYNIFRKVNVRNRVQLSQVFSGVL